MDVRSTYLEVIFKGWLTVNPLQLSIFLIDYFKQKLQVVDIEMLRKILTIIVVSSSICNSGDVIPRLDEVLPNIKEVHFEYPTDSYSKWLLGQINYYKTESRNYLLKDLTFKMYRLKIILSSENAVHNLLVVFTDVSPVLARYFLMDTLYTIENLPSKVSSAFTALLNFLDKVKGQKFMLIARKIDDLTLRVFLIDNAILDLLRSISGTTAARTHSEDAEATMIVDKLLSLEESEELDVEL